MLNKHAYDQIGVAPQALSGTTPAKGTGIDRLAVQAVSGGPALPEALRVVITTGATTGTPDSFSVTAQLQHSADDVDGNYSAVPDFDTANLSHTAITAASTTKAFPVDARSLKQFVRVVLTPAFVGGSGPTVLAGATLDWTHCRAEPAIV